MSKPRPKAITRFEDSETIANTYIDVGATVNGDFIEDIWVSASGTPFFVICGIEYSWEELLAILVDGEVPRREVD
jgi:hypothetical protein